MAKRSEIRRIGKSADAGRADLPVVVEIEFAQHRNVRDAGEQAQSLIGDVVETEVQDSRRVSLAARARRLTQPLPR